MLKFITIVLVFGVAAAAPSGLYLAGSPASTIHTTRFAYAPAPITYAEPATLTRLESASSPLTYTASHQPAVALTNVQPLTYNYASYPIGYNGLGFAY
ncbi:uncharacterized protein LOC119080975 isoform X2 [Bradysia coprophila]|uniref:uncharacterized protein LOC119080975 isoform X2 n=1 Tax=Bradysia coprophila TaxID=38358 RepID=UPI00187DB786|nr:uncharacterized protein LOC119080975 isoform X2 [Bradysia coprophila]